MCRLIFLVCALLAVDILCAQSVGITDDGTAPAPGAALDVKSSTKGLLLPGQTTVQRSLISNPADGLLLYDNQAGLVYNYAAGTGWRGFINNNYWLGFTGTVYNAAANIGIGSTTPQEKLHVFNGNLKVTSGNLTIGRSSGLIQKIGFDYTGSSPGGVSQGIDYSTNSSGARNAYINYIASAIDGQDELRLYPSVTGLHLLNLFSNGEFRFSANDGPTFQLQEAGFNKGFFQISGDDLRLGTNSGNTAGSLIIRTNGTNRVYINRTGNVGIGVSNPTEALHINGNTSNQNSIDVNARTTTNTLTFGGRFTKPSVSSAALTPICYGSVNADGTAKSITPNASVSKISTGYYNVTCTGLDSTCMILVTAGADLYLAKGYMSSTANTMAISTFLDRSTAPPARRDVDFCFVVYKR